MYADYTDRPLTGLDMIDTQHQELIDRINKLVESCDENTSKSVAMKTLDFLSDFATFHITSEEQLQRELTYPNYEEHKAQHHIFKQTLRELEQLLEEENGLSGAFTSKVQEQIVEWSYQHINEFDKPFALYSLKCQNK